jgi:hypothetical protein
MSHHVLDEQTVYEFLTNDFESAWDCLANTPGDRVGRGNFMFALQATILLEWVSRLCTGDDAALDSVASALEHEQPRYFLKMPGQARHPGFKLLNRGAERQELLAFIFDHVRNGQSHTYHQISADLPHDKRFQIGLSGAAHQHWLRRLYSGERAERHLKFEIQDEVGWLVVDAGMFFIDVRRAIDATGVLRRGLKFPFSDFSRKYDFTLEALSVALS